MKPLRKQENLSSDKKQLVVESELQEIRKALVARKEEIKQAIREYPRPITACDDQFNLLLEQRATITREIVRFDREMAQIRLAADGRKALEAFVAGSLFASAVAGKRASPQAGD